MNEAPKEAVVNTLSVWVKEVGNVPPIFASYGMDAKGAASTHLADHVFAYTLTATLPQPTASESARPTSATPPPPNPMTTTEADSPRPETSGLKVTHEFTGGRLKPIEPDDEKLVELSAQIWEEGRPVDPTYVPPDTTTPQLRSPTPKSSTPAPDPTPIPPVDPADLPPRIAWYWNDWDEKKEEDEHHGGKKAAQAKPKGKPTPAQIEEERKKREEEEREKERLAAEAALHPPPPPANTCQLEFSAGSWTMLEELADEGKPLTFFFRRQLRQNVPAEWNDVNEARYRAEIPIPLEPFLEPGVTEYEFTVPLYVAPPEPEPEDKAPDKGKKGATKKPAPKGKGKMEVPPTVIIEEDPQAPSHYTEAETYVTLAFRLAKPLVHLPEHRPRPEFRPKDLIPRRIKPHKRVPDCSKAYADEVKDIVLSLVEEWKAQSTSKKNVPVEEMRADFLEALNSKGLSHSYKEKLKHCVVRIVKEKFNKKPNTSKEEMQAFYNELYVCLLDLMHRAINEMFARSSLAVSHFVAEENKSHSRWKRLADEAEEMREFALAAKYHQERLVHESENPKEGEAPDVWYEYGTFALRVRDIAKAEQAFKEAIALDMNHLSSLMGYGLLLLNKKLYPEAEVFLQSAVDVNVDAVLPWSCLGLLMELTALAETDEFRQKEKNKEAAYSYNQAKRLLAIQSQTGSRPGTAGSASMVEAPSLYLNLADFLLKLHFEQLADHCLTNEAKRVGTGIPYFMLSGQLAYQQENYDRGEQLMKKVIELKPKADNQNAKLLLANIYRQQGRNEEAIEQFDLAIGMEGRNITWHTYVRLGAIQMSMKKFEDARDNYLWGAKAWPCGLTWHGVGVAYYRLADFEHAEQALNEANILNNLNPLTWAYLCLVCLKLKRPEEADQAFDQALKQQLHDADIIAEIGVEQLAAGRVRLAEGAFRLSLKKRESTATRLQLGKTLAQMRLFDDAKAELAAVISATEDDDEREDAGRQLAVLTDAVQA
eukprot:NODE_130_length_3226_cov_46.311634_g121_i0.p1 GENE.NODE_130_length_3226_cov_46.311634_g121_i0~~NODE_130_length_3226_cov_46.311634_g121_i0.p1  ORF type:complete len:992 (+),score=263.49 NODE_130_length_3226_cov_46.311634_g121_i0:89-3064(+)